MAKNAVTAIWTPEPKNTQYKEGNSVEDGKRRHARISNQIHVLHNEKSDK
jgi:hypothetical protein